VPAGTRRASASGSAATSGLISIGTAAEPSGWRDTTAPFWQNHVDLGKVTRFVVKGVSKDDVIFGVQSVDREGNVSPAAYPKPAR